MLELMLSLLIIGIMLGLGISYIGTSISDLREVSSSFAANLAKARVDAMLSRQKVNLEIEENRIYQRDAMGGKNLVQILPKDTQITIDGKSLMMGGRERFIFSPLGFTMERLVHLHDGKEFFSIYVPSIGAPFAIAGMRNLEEMRKDGS